MMKTKHLNIDSAHLKFDEANRTFEGYASVFNSVDAYGDTIMPGAYEDTLKERERPIRMRWNHWGPVVGKWMDIYEDDTGLYVKGQLTEGHSTAEDVYASLKHGAVDGLSIGFRVPIDGAEENEHGGYDLYRIDLIEISVVEEPADLGARISDVKELTDAIGEIETLKQAETCLRDACGFSRSAATAFVGRVKTMCQSESGTEETQSESEEGRVKLNWKLFKHTRLQVMENHNE